MNASNLRWKQNFEHVHCLSVARTLFVCKNLKCVSIKCRHFTSWCSILPSYIIRWSGRSSLKGINNDCVGNLIIVSTTSTSCLCLWVTFRNIYLYVFPNNFEFEHNSKPRQNESSISRPYQVCKHSIIYKLIKSQECSRRLWRFDNTKFIPPDQLMYSVQNSYWHFEIQMSALTLALTCLVHYIHSLLYHINLFI